MKKVILLIVLLTLLILPSLVSASTTITDTSIETTGNLTLGQKITFNFGEILDNLVDGWLKITGNLNVTGNATISGTSFKVNNQEVCLVDGTNCKSSAWNITTSPYLYNNSGVLDVNETKLNSTINAKTLFPMGEVSLTNNAVVTVITGADTWTLVNASWDENSDSMMFQNYTNGTLEYTGTETMFFHIAMTISISGESPNKIMRASIFKNGVILPGGQIQQKIAGGGDIDSTAIHVATSLSTGDELNVYLLNQNDASDFTVTYANMFAMGMRTG